MESAGEQTGVDAPRESGLSVVLLTKRFPLADFLQNQLAQAGYLGGTVYEHRSRTEALKRIYKREGLLRCMDVLGYQFFDRFLRVRQSALRSLGSAAKRPAAPELDVANANSQEARDFIAALRPDVLVVHATGLLKPETFTLAPVAINLHCGILPRYRGHDTIFWALANHDSENLGATLHLIDAGADTGGLLKCCFVEPSANDTDLTLWIRSFVAGVGGLMELLRDNRFEVAEGAPGRYPHWPHRGVSDYLKYRMYSAGGPRRGR